MSESPPVDHREPVVVATYTDLGEAEIAQAKLRAFGIEAEILDQAEGGVIPTIELPVGIGVSVRAIDADDAFRILSDTTGSEAVDRRLPPDARGYGAGPSPGWRNWQTLGA